jgi:hypothetical protein
MVVNWNFVCYDEFWCDVGARKHRFTFSTTAALVLSSGECNNLLMLFCFLNSGNQNRLQGGQDYRRIPACNIIAEECNRRNITRLILVAHKTAICHNPHNSHITA